MSETVRTRRSGVVNGRPVRGERGPQGAPGSTGATGVKGDKGDVGAQGERGLPGVNAVPADEAVAAYASDPDSQTRETLLSTIELLAASRKSAAPVALGSRSAGFEEYPTLERIDHAWFPFAAQGAPSMLWCCPVDMRGFPGALDNIYVWYSTDHGTDPATTGVHLATMTTPEGGGLVYRGRVLSTIGGATWTQPESPSVWRSDSDGLLRSLMQVNTGVIPPGEAQAEQVTRMFTSPTGLDGTWSDAGLCMARPSSVTPGPAHCGYAPAHRYAGSWYAHTLMGGSSGANVGQALWRSDGDGLPGTWVADPYRVGGAEQTVDLPGYSLTWNVKWIYCTILDYRGRPWFVGLIGPSAAGLEDTSLCDIYTAPLTTDLRHFAAKPVKITPPLGSWGTDPRVGTLGRPMQYDDGLYIPFRVDTKTTDWGIFKIATGREAAA